MRKNFRGMLGAFAFAALPLLLAGVAMAQTPKTNQYWWPDQLDRTTLRQHSADSNPLGKDFDYAKGFKSLDLNAVKQVNKKVLSTLQPWWPSDYGNYGNYGNYGPFFIRMAWHSAGTYRVDDGRSGSSGGQL